MQQATLGKSGSKTASQLQGRRTRAFSSNSLVKPWKLGLLFNIVLQQHNSLALRIAIKSLE